MAKQQQPDLPFVSMITDDEIAQAICNYAAKKQLGIDPEVCQIDFKITYRQVKIESGQRLFASIVIMGITTPPLKDESKRDAPA